AVAPIAVAVGQVHPLGGDLEGGRALGVLAIVLIPGTGHVVFNWAHAHTTLVTTSLLTLAMPVISTIAAALFLDQRVVLVQALGIVVVLVALAVVIVGDARS